MEDFELKITRNLSLYAPNHLADKATASFHYTSIASDIINELKISDKCRRLGEQNGFCAAPIYPHSTAMSRLDPPKAQTLANSFRKGVKQDLALFHRLKYQLQLDQLHMNLRFAARLKKFDNVLDVSYVSEDKDGLNLLDK